MKRRYAIAGFLAAAAGAAAVARRQEHAWREAEDPGSADFFGFPAGASIVVTTSDGAALAVTVAGAGPTVVLAHGWTNTHAVWAPVARRLVAGGRRVIAYDQRGHGESTLGSDPFTIDRLGADLADVLAALDVDDAVVAGHSMGGMTVMALIGDAPEVVADRVRAVVLVSTAMSGLGGRRAVLDRATGRVLESPQLSRAMAGPLGPHLVRGAVGVRPQYGHLREMSREFATTSRTAIGGAFRAMSVMDLSEGLKRCLVPATVIVGEKDQLTRPSLGRAIADGISGAEFVLLPRVGHMAPLEAPDRVAELIIAAGGPTT